MTVRDLIYLLSKCDQDSEIFFTTGFKTLKDKSVEQQGFQFCENSFDTVGSEEGWTYIDISESIKKL